MTRPPLRRLLIFVALWLIFVALWGTASLAQDDEKPQRDRQFRGEVEVSAPLYRDFSLSFAGDLRLARAEDDRFVRGEAGMLYRARINSHFALVPRYRYRVTREFHGSSESEHRLSLDSVLRFSRRNFTLTDNNLLERRFLDSGPETRYRNRLRLNYALPDPRSELFVSDEVYYEFQEKAWTRNRFQIGVNRRLSDQISAELYYMRQRDRFDQPARTDVLGIEIDIELR